MEKSVGAGIETGKNERNTAYRLLNLAWQSRLEKLGLIRHALANDKCCFAFPDGLIDGNEINFQTSTGRKGHRGVVGYKTRINAKGESWLRHWHFAIQPIPAFSPQLMVMVRTHVLFSEDGKNLWTSATRLQKARRNQCMNWWNDAWRDRVLAVMSWLANGQESITLDVGSPEPIAIEREPVEFASPVSYVVPAKPSADADDTRAPDISDLDDDDDDGDFDADVDLEREET